MRHTSLGIATVVAAVALGIPCDLFGQNIPMPLPLGGPGAPPPVSPVEPPAVTPDASQQADIETEARESNADTPREPNLKRDPFWPVGYTPKPRVAATTTNESATTRSTVPEEKPIPVNWDAARKTLDIRGISLIGRDKQTNTAKYLAMIGGKLVEVGDIVSVSYMSRIYRWKVTSISPDGISLAKQDLRPE